MQLSQEKMALERGSGEVEVGTLTNHKKQNSHDSKEKGSNVKDSSSAENARDVNKKCDKVTLSKRSLLLQRNRAMKDASLVSRPSMTMLKPKAELPLAQGSGSPVDADATEGTPWWCHCFS